MAKRRDPVPGERAAKVLFAADHTCCVCRDRGRPVQIHHIDEDPSNNDERNLSVLCLICHDQTQVKGGFGRKLDATLVTEYRDDWQQRVEQRREKADEIASMRMAGTVVPVEIDEQEDAAVMVAADPKLVEYVEFLPERLAAAYAISRPRWDSGATLEMLQGTFDIIDVVTQMLVRLASWFPIEHFDNLPATEYFSRFVSSRFLWHRALAEPGGVGTGGTIVGPSAAAGVLSDIENAVAELVSALLWGREGFRLKAWRARWKAMQQ